MFNLKKSLKGIMIITHSREKLINAVLLFAKKN